MSPGRDESMSTRYVSPGLTRKTGDPVTIEDYAGSDCSGSGGVSSRILTLANAELSMDETVFLDGTQLADGTHYAIVNSESLSQITFSIPVWDDQEIRVIYYT